MEGEIRVNASPLFNYALHEMYPLLQVFVILVKYESVIFAEINYITRVSQVMNHLHKLT